MHPVLCLVPVPCLDEHAHRDTLSCLISGDVPNRYECVLDTNRPYNEVEFSCTLPMDIPPGYYALRVSMLPNGV